VCVVCSVCVWGVCGVPKRKYKPGSQKNILQTYRLSHNTFSSPQFVASQLRAPAVRTSKTIFVMYLFSVAEMSRLTITVAENAGRP